MVVGTIFIVWLECTTIDEKTIKPCWRKSVTCVKVPKRTRIFKKNCFIIFHSNERKTAFRFSYLFKNICIFIWNKFNARRASKRTIELNNWKKGTLNSGSQGRACVVQAQEDFIRMLRFSICSQYFALPFRQKVKPNSCFLNRLDVRRSLAPAGSSKRIGKPKSDTSSHLSPAVLRSYYSIIL